MVALAYPPAVGGAASYAQTLVQGFLERDLPQRIVLLVEAHPHCPRVEKIGDRILILRIFPFRSQLTRRDPKRYWLYFWQNLCYLLIPWLIYRFSISHVLVHAQSHYFPGLMARVRSGSQFLQGVTWIADVRDPQMAETRFPQLYGYPRIICSAQNVYQHLAQDSTLKPKLTVIPIPLVVPSPSPDAIAPCLDRYHLPRQKFIFSGNGISQEKNIVLTLQVARYCHDLYPDYIWAIAGEKKDWNADCEQGTQDGWLVYLGFIPQDDLLLLMQASALVVNLATIDSPSRYILEAIALGANVLLPAGVPEFARCCPQLTVRSSDAKAIAHQIGGLLDCPQGIPYDLSQHAPDAVIPRYLELFSQ